nr:hypothetical protein Q903MT_gene755 [Picea sitchensis]
MMIQVHEGVCGPHMNGQHRLAKKRLRLGYYSCTMERGTCFHFVQRCHKCQVHANLIHAPPKRQTPYSRSPVQVDASLPRA